LKQVIRLILSALLLAGVLSATITTKPVQPLEVVAEAQDNRNKEGAPIAAQVQLQEGYYQSPIQFIPDFPLQTDHQQEFHVAFQSGSLPTELLNTGISFQSSRLLQCLLTCIQAQAP